jgi:putative nucleotidyltransferase with HDIG domain
MKIHPLLKEAASIFTAHGKQVYLVGGTVRDMLRGVSPGTLPEGDWDLATNARPEEVMKIFRHVVPTGIKHGTVTIHYKGRFMETTTFRTESDYSDGRRPDKIAYAAAIEEDLSRRDLTMNAIALKLPEGTIIDPFNGAGDIKGKRIRAVGNPGERFREDGLRPLRALRFASQLGFSLDEATLAAIPLSLSVTARVAQERIRDELEKILGSPKPSTALLLMEKTGLLALLLPELSACRNIEQTGFHRFDVLDHSLLACDFTAALNSPPEVRLAALFHDLGKPLTRRQGEDGTWTFYRHEKESALLTRQIMTRFRYPRAVTDQAAHLVEEHMFNYREDWGDAAVRRFIIRVGRENLPLLYALRRADTYGMAGIAPPPDYLLPLINRVEESLAQSQALCLKDMAVSGGDLMEIGIKPGKYMGIILKELLEAVLEDPGLNSRETLLDIAERIKQKREGLGNRDWGSRGGKS